MKDITASQPEPIELLIGILMPFLYGRYCDTIWQDTATVFANVLKAAGMVEDKNFVMNKQLRAADVKEGDILEIQFGEKITKYKVLNVTEHATKQSASEMYELLK